MNIFQKLQQEAWRVAEEKGLHTIKDPYEPREYALNILASCYHAITSITQSVKKHGIPDLETWKEDLFLAGEKINDHFDLLEKAATSVPAVLHNPDPKHCDWQKTLLLIHTEVDEAIATLRRYISPELTTPEVRYEIGLELADIVIRCLDASHKMGINLFEVVTDKMALNRKRPYGFGTPLEHADEPQ